MGAELSQNIVVDFEKITNNRQNKPWESLINDKLFKTFMVNKENSGTTNITPALSIINMVFKSFKHELNILEVGSGNGFNTSMVSNLDNIKSLTATDMLKYENTYYCIEQKLSHIAVQEYEEEIDILLMISPPPMGLMDYYAIKEYEIKNQKRTKYLMFLGELGASDGSEGIYHYLMKGSEWRLLHEQSYHVGVDIYGGQCIKKVYFFRYKDLPPYAE